MEGVNKIPDILKSFEKKAYTITIVVSEENVTKGSNVFHASNISKPHEVTDTHSPGPNKNVVAEQKEIIDVSFIQLKTICFVHT